MDPPLGELRHLMYQRGDHHVRRLAPSTYLERAKRRADRPDDLAEVFHENTKYAPTQMDTPSRSVRAFERRALRFVQANIDQDYAGAELVPFPPRPRPRAVTIAEVLGERRSRASFGGSELGFGRLAGLLETAMGPTGTVEAPPGTDERWTKRLRAYPSAGALYPVEAYVVARRCAGLDPGTYYYPVGRRGLRALEVDPPGLDDAIASVFTAARETGAAAAAALVVLTGAFWRTAAKYGPRGYRYVLQESGHVAQNLQLAATALDVATLPVGGFFDDRLNALLGVDGVDEAAVYLVAIGTPPGVADA